MSKMYCVNMIVCERMLVEQDGIGSLIRMLDVLQVAENLIATASLMLTVFSMGRSKETGDDKHTLRLDLIRPDGEVTATGLTQDISLKPALPGPGGFNFIANVAFTPKQYGLHFFVLVYDGAEIGRVPLTVIEPIQSAPQQSHR